MGHSPMAIRYAAYFGLLGKSLIYNRYKSGHATADTTTTRNGRSVKVEVGAPLQLPQPLQPLVHFHKRLTLFIRVRVREELAWLLLQTQTMLLSSLNAAMARHVRSSYFV